MIITVTFFSITIWEIILKKRSIGRGLQFMKLKKAKDDIFAANLLMKSENNPGNGEGIYDLAAYPG